jgi:hypothetical protein
MLRTLVERLAKQELFLLHPVYQVGMFIVFTDLREWVISVNQQFEQNYRDSEVIVFHSPVKASISQFMPLGSGGAILICTTLR